MFVKAFYTHHYLALKKWALIFPFSHTQSCKADDLKLFIGVNIHSPTIPGQADFHSKCISSIHPSMRLGTNIIHTAFLANYLNKYLFINTSCWLEVFFHSYQHICNLYWKNYELASVNVVVRCILNLAKLFSLHNISKHNESVFWVIGS